MQREYKSIGVFPIDKETYAILAVLNHHEVDYKTEKLFFQDITINFELTNQADQLEVLVWDEQMELANEVLGEAGLFVFDDESVAEQDIYELEGYSDEELLRVLKNSDEWGEGLQQQAEAVLKKRGIEVDENHKRQLKQMRKEELAVKEEQVHGLDAKEILVEVVIPMLMVFGAYSWLEEFYYLSFAVCTYDLWKGWRHASQKKVNATGVKIYVYDEETRKKGRALMIISGSLLLTTLWLVFLMDMWM